MPEFSIERIGDHVYQIDAWMEEGPERLACYLFDTPERVLVEVGPSATVHHLAAALDHLGVDDVARIVVTHIHIDHAGAVGHLIPRFPGARVGVHRRGARHLADPSRLWSSAASVFGEERLTRMWGTMEPVDPGRIDELDEGDRIDLGGGRSLEVLYTPGHARHHVVFHDTGDGGMFVGDALGLCYPHGRWVQPVTPPPDFDPEVAIEQMHRMAERDPSFVGFAHFGLRHDARAAIEEAERRLVEWVRTIESLADLDDDAAVAALKAWYVERMQAEGHTMAEIEGYLVKTFWPMQVAGVRHWLARRDGAG